MEVYRFLHKRQCLVTIIFTNLPSLLPLSFHEMIFILVLYRLREAYAVVLNERL